MSHSLLFKLALVIMWQPSILVMIVSENVSYTRYTRAFCQVGLPSTLATAFWTKSKNIQQKGASRVITKSPAHICQIPATIHNGERVMQHQKPKNTATRMRKKEKWMRIGRLDFRNLLMYRQCITVNSNSRVNQNF